MYLGYLQWFSEDFMANQAVDLVVLQEQTDHVLDRIPGR